MFRLLRIRKESAYFAATVLGTLVLGLALNAWFQTERYFAALLPKAEFAVFLTTEGLSSPEVTGKAMADIQGVTGVSFISREEALVKACTVSPDLDGVLIPGDNPFSPYFAVRAYDSRTSTLPELTEKIRAVAGVEEVRYDTEIFRAAEYLKDITRFYSAALAAVVIGLVLLSLGRFISKWFYRKADYRRYLYLVIWGLVCGGMGALLYYLAARYLITSPAVHLPLKYLAGLVPGGVLITLAWDK